MPPAEEPGLYRRPGNRKLYRVDAVLGWLPGSGGTTPWHWARRYLGSAWYIQPEHLDDRECMLEWIAQVETWRHISRPWRWRSVEQVIEQLRADYEVT